MTTTDREIFTNAHLLIRQHGLLEAQELSVRKIMDMQQQRDALGALMWQRVSAAIDALSKDGPGAGDTVN